MTCDGAMQAIDALFVGELDARSFAALREHVAHCAGCRDQYERIARVEAVLEKGSLSPDRAQILEPLLLARVKPLEAPGSAWWHRLMPALGALALLLLALPLSRAAQEEFQARSGRSSTFGVRAFCVAVGPTPKVTAEARPGGRLACPPGSAVQFTYTAPRASRLHIDIPASGQRFFPTDDASGAVGTGVDVPLPFSTPVSDWLEGPTQVRARFFDEAGKVLGETTLTLEP